MVLFVDGHHSHMGVDLIMSAREAGIQILCLPPHTTHILKPLDVGSIRASEKCMEKNEVLERIEVKEREKEELEAEGRIRS